MNDQPYTAKIIAQPMTTDILRRPKAVSSNTLAVGDSVLVAWRHGASVGVVTDTGETHNIAAGCVARVEHEGVGDLRATVWNAVTKDVIDTADARELYAERVAAVRALGERGKRCKNCGKWLPVTQFNVQYAGTGARRERRHSACVQCRNESRRAQYATSIG